MSAKDLSKLSDDDLMKIVSQPQQESRASKLSDDDLLKIAGSDISQQMDDASKMSRGKAALIGAQQGVSLGFRPVLSGASAGLGSIIGNFEQNVPGEGIAGKLQRIAAGVPKAYEEGRSDAITEEAQAEKDRPGYNIAGKLGGTLLTAPMAAFNTAKGALALGGVQGAGKALSEEQSLPDAAKTIGTDAGLSLLTLGAMKGLQRAGPTIKDALGNAASTVGDKIGSGAAKIGSALTGVSEGDIKTYSKYANEISQMAKASDGNVSEAADQVRQEFTKSLNSTRANLNQQISGALASSDKSVEVQPIIEALSSQKSKINPVLYDKEVGQIDGLIQKVGSLAKDGKVSVSDAHDIKAFLQDRASSAYGRPGDPASLGTEAAKAAKSGAAIARKLVNTAEPAVASANNQLSKLHDILDDMNHNILNEGKPEAALLAAGSGGNQRNASALQELGQATGTDMLGQAQKLSAMRSFSNPQLLPVDSTGKAFARMATGAGAGTLFGGPVGALVGGALTSPAALKLAINSGRISKSAIDAVMGRSMNMTQDGLQEAVKYLNTPQGMAALSRVAIQQTPSSPIERRLERISTQNRSEK